MGFLGIDLGTSAVKLLLLNEAGEVVQTVSKEYPVFYPKTGWAEQNPEDWWEATRKGISEILGKVNPSEKDIQGIGISGQMHGLVLLDQKDDILLPAILWCDQRTQAECDFINKELGVKLSEYTGNQALTGFTAPKLLWVKKNHPEVFGQIAHILLPKDYIRFKLTGEYATDVSDASGTLMFDVGKRQWSAEMLDFLGIEKNALPNCYESYEITGSVTKAASVETDLLPGVKVVGGGGDQACGAVGTGVVSAGTVSVALGTSGVVFACQEDYAVDSMNRLHSFCHANGKWHVMGVMLAAASCLKWWVEEVNHLDDSGYNLLLSEAEKVAAGSDGLIFLPYLMGERTPYSDPYARGSFIGLTMTHTRAHMTRAILEGVSFALKDSLEIIYGQNIPVERVRVSGGGAKSKLWRQILADILNLPVDVVNSVEGPAFGAAILAAVGLGAFGSVEHACSKLIKTVDTVEPNLLVQQKYKDMYFIYHSLYGTLQKTFVAINKI